MDFEWLKIVLERIKLIDLAISGACVAGFALLVDDNVWWLILIGCLAYIIVTFCRFMIERYKQKVSDEEEAETDRVIAEKKNNDFKREAWLRYYSMPDKVLNLAVSAYKGEMDPSDKYTRIIKNDNRYLYEQIDSYYASEFRIYKSDREYYPLVRARYFDRNSIFEFNPYFFSLVEHYVQGNLYKKIARFREPSEGYN